MDRLEHGGPTTARPAIVHATSNGTGMGHLTRQMSVALALEQDYEPLFFSLSSAVGVIGHYRFRGEYCPSRERGWIPQTRWQGYLRERLTAFVRETGAKAVVFDGVVPYLGLLRARMELPDVAFVWQRRGFWRPGVRTTPLRTAALFDLVLEPGDLAAAGDTGATADRDDAVALPPISLTEHLEPLTRGHAAAELGLAPDRPTALITLSSGVLNDVTTPGVAAIATLLEDPEWQVAVTRSALSRDGIPLDGGGDPARCVELSGVYPLARYLNAFDCAVAAGGYNSVHELLYAGLPTLFVPNRSSGTDDQPARTRWLADAGFALFADETDLDAVRAQARRLHDATVRAELAAACRKLERPTGSAAAASALTQLLAGPPPSRRARLREAETVALLTALQALGPRGTAVIRTALRRGPGSGPPRPMPVRVVDGSDAGPATAGITPLLLTDRLDAEVLGSGVPVEHLIDTAGPAYREQRLRIVRRYYDVCDSEDT